MSADRSPAEYGKLQKVLDLRVGRAKRQYLEKRAQYDELLVAAEKLQKEVDGTTSQYEELVEQLAITHGNCSVETLTDISNRRYWLNFDLELQRYYLDIANSDVSEAAEELAVLKKIWMNVDAREQAVGKMRKEAAHKAMLLDELKADLEQGDVFVSKAGVNRG